MLQSKLIDYRLLAEACHFYNTTGYQQIEVPWVVDAEFSRMTSPIPGNGYSFVLDDSRHLIASAEQGFVEMMYGALLTSDTLYFAVSYYATSHYAVENGELRIGYDGTPFLTPITDPEKLADEVTRWLAEVTYPAISYGGDGSTKKGWRVEVSSSGWKNYMSIKPTWIIYSK